jgi:hypothetical protein
MKKLANKRRFRNQAVKKKEKIKKEIKSIKTKIEKIKQNNLIN